METRNKIAFTLIELLVVIAIIGILSGLIVVTMSGVTAKANIAKVQIFSNSLRNAMMANLISEWKFDNDVNDSWGTNNGTLTGAIYDNNDNECIHGGCLYFGGTINEYVQMLAIPSITTGTPFMISVWIYPQIGASYQTIVGYNSAHRLLIEANGTLLSQQDGNFYSATRGIMYDAWSHVLYWNDGTKERWYINGKQSGSTHETVNAEWTADFKVGQYDLVNYPYKGRIDELRIYNSAASISLIKEQYYSGLNSLFMNGSMTKEDYISRINNYAVSN
ncbi:MAG: prepilin-type N-terminal cleavage/methylation domain-containing protein [Candidatus Pacebacteria bacterium]|nr:prepilin-type N-terminal cleavage/methylation domain-containing protein [Candidatus Paceibacterota bacterium]